MSQPNNKVALVTGGSLLLKAYMGAGHGGDSRRFDQLKETAMEYAFAIDTLPVDTRKESSQSGPSRSDSYGPKPTSLRKRTLTLP